MLAPLLLHTDTSQGWNSKALCQHKHHTREVELAKYNATVCAYVCDTLRTDRCNCYWYFRQPRLNSRCEVLEHSSYKPFPYSFSNSSQVFAFLGRITTTSR
eukprot:m.10183 g.10183  ORF g.10183 m.10183 type:complete len:101 (+) comp6537_c0_seq2:484-786(+)